MSTSRKFKIVGIVALVKVVLITAVLVTTYWPHTVVATVNSKEKQCMTTEDCSYRVYTDGGTFENVDSFLWWKFNSADYQGALKDGYTYELKVVGWRFGYWSMFENIVAYKEIDNPFKKCGKLAMDNGDQLTGCFMHLPHIEYNPEQ